MKRKIYRQGDVLLVPITQIPKQAENVSHDHGRLILARGEATGHHHSIAMQDADLLQVPSQAELFLLVKEGSALLEHQEHGTIPIAKGAYRVVIQREYSPEQIRRVVD